MNTSTWIVDAKNEASRFGASKEENQNYLPEFNYGSSTKEVTLPTRGSNAEVPTTVQSFTPTISKQFSTVAFGEKLNGEQDSVMAPNLSETPLLSNIGSVPHTPQYRSPNPEGKKISVSAVTPVCVKVSMTDLSPLSDCDIIRLDCSEADLAIGELSDVDQQYSLSKKDAEWSKMSDDDEDLLKMRQDVLSSRGTRRFSDVSDSYLSSTEDQAIVLKNEEDLLKSRRGRRRFSDVSESYLNSTEDQAVVLKYEEDLLKSSDKDEVLESGSDLDISVVEDLLKSSDEEEPRKNKDERKVDCGYFGVNERAGCSAEEGFTMADIKGEPAQQVGVVNSGDDFKGSSMMVDEECLRKDSDSELGVSGARYGAVKGKEVAFDNESKFLPSVDQVGASEKELWGDEEHVRLTEDGYMVFSEHSDDEDEADLLGEDDADLLGEDDILIDEVKEEDELEVIFVQENKGVECKPSAEKLNEEASRCSADEEASRCSADEEASCCSANEEASRCSADEEASRCSANEGVSRCSADEEVDFSVNFSQVQETKSAGDELSVQTKSAGEELSVGEEKRTEPLGRDEFVLQSGEESLHNTVEYFLDVFAEILEEENVSSQPRSSVGLPIAESENKHAEGADDNELGKFCESVSQQYCEDDQEEVKDTEPADEYSVVGTGEVAPVVKRCCEDLILQLDEEVSVPQNRKEQSGSQICEEDTVSLFSEEVSVPQNGKEQSGSQTCEEDTVSLFSEEVPVLRHVDVKPMVLQPCEEVSVSQNVEPDKQIVEAPVLPHIPVFKLIEEVVVSQHIETAGSQCPEKVSFSQGAEETPFSQRNETVGSQSPEIISDSQGAEKTQTSQRIETVGSQRLETVGSQRIEIVGSQRLETVGSQRIETVGLQPIETVGLQRPQKVLGSQSAEETSVSQRIETVGLQGLVKVLGSQNAEETPVSQRVGIQTSRRVEVPVSQHVEEVPVSQRAAEIDVPRRVDNLFTRRHGQCRPLLDASLTQNAVHPLPLFPMLPSATFTRRDSAYPYQRSVDFPEENLRSRQAPNLSDRWRSQQTIDKVHFSGPSDFSNDISTDFSTDFMWDYQHNRPSQWNHIPNGPLQWPTMHFPDESPTRRFDIGFVSEPSGYFGGVQISPPLLADETSTDSKSGGFAAKSYDNFNEEEIRDNNDPRWEEIRSLKTDAERYASLLNRWGSLTMPDPRKNLTTHNYLLRNRARNLQGTESKTPIFTNGRKRRASSSLFGERPGKRLCSILDDKFEDVDRKTAEEIERLNDERTFEIEKIEREKEETISDLMTVYGPHFLSDDYFERIEYDTFQKKEQVNSHFGRIIDDVWKQKIKATEELKGALDEMVAFYKFYGDDSNVRLTPEEVETFVEQERMFSMYDKFYSKV